MHVGGKLCVAEGFMIYVVYGRRYMCSGGGGRGGGRGKGGGGGGG